MNLNHWVNVMPSGSHAWRILDERELLSEIKIKAYMERIDNMKNTWQCVGQKLYLFYNHYNKIKVAMSYMPVQL